MNKNASRESHMSFSAWIKNKENEAYSTFCERFRHNLSHFDEDEVMILYSKFIYKTKKSWSISQYRHEVKCG